MRHRSFEFKCRIPQWQEKVHWNTIKRTSNKNLVWVIPTLATSNETCISLHIVNKVQKLQMRVHDGMSIRSLNTWVRSTHLQRRCFMGGTLKGWKMLQKHNTNQSSTNNFTLCSIFTHWPNTRFRRSVWWEVTPLLEATTDDIQKKPKPRGADKITTCANSNLMESSL